MRILAAQLNPIIGDVEGNSKKIIHALELARKKQMEIVLFSELAICGYPPEDLLLHASFVQTIEKYLEKIVAASKGLFVVVGTVRRNSATGEKGLFNSAAVIADGKLLGYHDKMLLPTYDVFDERRYFEPGAAPQVWDYKGKKIAILICEDIWQHAGVLSETRYKCDPVLELKPLKPDVLLNLSSSPYHFQKPDIRLKVNSKTASTLHCPLVICYQVGANDSLVFDGYSSYFDKEGNLCQIAKAFEEDLLFVDLAAPAQPIHFSYDPIEDLYKALVLGVRDYFHKLGFKKGCLGLSGGIDSALVACIAVDALGKENVLALSMPSRFSSKESVTDAEILVRNLGIELDKVSIEKPFEDYLKLLQPLFKGRPPDITEENLQARIRAMILMAISNKLGYILLSTGNKSEMAMGYCTLYGDMSGGMAVISDVSKAQVYALSNWLNRKQEIIPQAIIDKIPTAELRPNQKDTDTLPEYPIVDAVLQGYVEDFLSPEEIAAKNQLPLELVRELIHKIHAAEYKRRQAAPGIRVTKKAFRAGRRYPIVQRWM